MLSAYHIYPCGDHALTIELGDSIDRGVNDRVMALWHFLGSHRTAGIRDIIPSYHTITLVYDLPWYQGRIHTGSVYDYLCKWLQDLIPHCKAPVETAARTVRMPVCYDTSMAWDIEHIASVHGITTEDVIALHTQNSYRVYLVGFLPGFPYMGTVDERLATPRKSTPRTMVPKGSVGIAGLQTGIYPFDSPGGWQIIGQTPVPLFDAAMQQPCYLQPGDEVRFYAIDLPTFHQIKRHGLTHH